MDSPSKSLLEGVRVLDLSRVLAGPYCTMMLADLGADIIKIEAPGLGDDTRHWGPPFAKGGESAYFLCVNRNKRSMTLNLKSERGIQILKELIRQSDVLVENFRVDTMDRWGLSYEALQLLHPGLIYCTITGYGYTGPYRQLPGYDFIIQAQGGVMSITGPEHGEPFKVGVAIADITAGLFACNAILAGLFDHQRSGRGQRIDISLLDSQIAWLANVGSNYLISGEKPQRYGNAHPNIVPYQTFKASDGYFALGIGNDGQWRQFCDKAGKPEWALDSRFRTNACRVENRGKLLPLLEDLFSQYEIAHWLSILEAVGVPCGPINSIDQLMDDPQVQARQMVIQVPHSSAGSIKMVASPLKIPTAPVELRLPPPMLGEHTEQILCDVLGFDRKEVEELRTAQVI
ncbi:MAG: formyl-CoA transferase [Chloroflexi bacterium RBG_19FT_COMBO_50_10]|nr:MAG: formyl-CoA transferase [Chloroflexi bacterium RBG_16_47_49]OGO66139.1 MAG: formyl-CoA transferase [Chloroflexi bacterium RBG_19FT_COMBO_50_10]